MQTQRDDILAVERFTSDMLNVLTDSSAESFGELEVLVADCIVGGAEERWRELYARVKRVVESGDGVMRDGEAIRRLTQFLIDNEDLA